MDAVRLATRGRYYTYRVALVAALAYLVVGGVFSYVLPPTIPLASLLYALLDVAVAAGAVGVVCSLLAWLGAASGPFGSDA